MSAHLPECSLSLPKRSPMDFHLDFPQDCICDRLRACEARVTERHNAEHEDDRLTAFQNGYEQGRADERKRSVLLIADAYGKGLDAARDAVAALMTMDGEFKRSAHAAIDALREVDTPTQGPVEQHVNFNGGPSFKDTEARKSCAE